MKENENNHCIPEILVVDDMSANAEMVSCMLKCQGYKVRMASSGKMALKAIQESPPDLVLLDINMPEMDGYEVCGRIKEDDKSKDVPVIFMSSLSEMMDKVKAFQVGGVDYVEKPFRIEEVLARIETHLKIRKLQNQLARHNQNLEKLVQERTNQLTEAHRRLAIIDRTKSEFLALISHELRTPLNGVFGVAELLFDEDEKDPERRELIDMFNLSRKNMMNILDDALLLTQIEVSGNTFSTKASPLNYIIDIAIDSVKNDAHSRNPVILSGFVPEGIDVQGDQKLLVKAFSSLLETAAKFSSAAPVTVSCKRLQSSVEVVISAKGCIIPADMLADFFDVFSSSKPIKDVGELGLGPPVANRIISLFGGSVVLRNDDPAGVSFIITCKTVDNV
jgi:DNA-binding response OmpR family regulator